MRYAITKSVNGTVTKVESEHTDLQSAIVSFHNMCAAFWNASDVTTATVAILDENLDVVGGANGYKEFITHTQTPAEEPVETEE